MAKKSDLLQVRNPTPGRTEPRKLESLGKPAKPDNAQPLNDMLTKKIELKDESVIELDSSIVLSS